MNMYLFALFLVLYEFITYSANDMIMPGMIQVVNYLHAAPYYVALSFSAYILGDCIFLLFAGFLSERYGKRKVILLGNFLFLFFSILIITAANIHQFIIYRCLQGFGLAVITIGYALIHEHFNDKAAIKLIALMANISILAPLIGPIIGSLIMSFFSWQYIFGLSAFLAAITLIGLYRYSPQDQSQKTILTLNQVVKQYGSILTNKAFLQGMLCSVAIIMPLMIWISQAPNLILYKLHLNYAHYVLYQLLSVGGIAISSVIMQYAVGRYRIFSIVHIGNIIAFIGLLISLLGSSYIEFISIGLLFYGLGMGLANGCIWRLTMTIKGYSHSVIASMLGFMQMLFFVTVLILVNQYISFHQFALWSFSWSAFLFGIIGFILIIIYISAYRDREWT